MCSFGQFRSTASRRSARCASSPDCPVSSHPHVRRPVFTRQFISSRMTYGGRGFRTGRARGSARRHCRLPTNAPCLLSPHFTACALRGGAFGPWRRVGARWAAGSAYALSVRSSSPGRSAAVEQSAPEVQHAVGSFQADAARRGIAGDRSVMGAPAKTASPSRRCSQSFVPRF